MSAPLRIRTASTLSTYVDSMFAEGVKSTLARRAITEKEKQGQAAPPTTDGSNSDEGGGALFDGTNDQSSSKTMDDETEKLKHGDVSAKDIVERLNTIRSGKSFKDSVVAKSMNDYINSLSKAERVALLAFMKGIAQVVTGDVPGTTAEDPSDHPADVQMSKETSTAAHGTVHVQPRVLRSTGGPKRSSEDTSSPTPIVPKR